MCCLCVFIVNRDRQAGRPYSQNNNNNNKSTQQQQQHQKQKTVEEA